MLFEGNKEVLVNLFKKKQLLMEGDASHQKIRPALLVLSGVMRGVYAGGQAIALDKAGFTDVFDVVVGVSTGAPVAAYFLAGHIQEGLTVYWHECTSRKFISPRRGFIGRRIVDIDYLASVFRGQTPRKVALDQEALHRSRSRFYTATTCGDTGEGLFLDAKSSNPDPIEALRATIAMPWLSHGNVVIDGRRYLDGVGAMPFPVQDMLGFCPTDLLVLANSPPQEKKGKAESFLLPFLLDSFPPPVREAFLTRHARFADELAFLRTQKECRFSILWTDKAIGRFERNPNKLETAAVRAEKHFADLLGEAASIAVNSTSAIR